MDTEKKPTIDLVELARTSYIDGFNAGVEMFSKIKERSNIQNLKKSHSAHADLDVQGGENVHKQSFCTDPNLKSSKKKASSVLDTVYEKSSILQKIIETELKFDSNEATQNYVDWKIKLIQWIDNDMVSEFYEFKKLINMFKSFETKAVSSYFRSIELFGINSSQIKNIYNVK